MTLTLMFMLLLSFVLLLTVLWLLLGSRSSKDNLTDAALEIHKLLPVHCKHFPSICRLLKKEDEEFVSLRAPRAMASQWRAERRQIIRLYVRGLAQDFKGLERLARLIAALSPEIKRAQEWEWLWLGLQFHLLYRMTLIRLVFHRLGPDELVLLTEMVTALNISLERWLDRLTESFPQAQLHPNN